MVLQGKLHHTLSLVLGHSVLIYELWFIMGGGGVIFREQASDQKKKIKKILNLAITF